jgi:hypothetical protein
MSEQTAGKEGKEGGKESECERERESGKRGEPKVEGIIFPRSTIISWIK